MHFRLLPVTLATLILLQACGSKKEQTTTKTQKKQPPTVVDVVIARTETVINTVEANGAVVANQSVELHPEVSGKIVYLNVPEGKYVSKGTVLARINDEDLRAQLQRSRIQLELAEKTVSRYKKLVDVGGINLSDYDAALSQVNTYQADIRVTEAQIGKTIIRAPFGGIVGLRQASLGTYASPTIAIASIQQATDTKIDFTVPEEYSRYVKPGTVVTVDMQGGTGTKARARVMAVEPQINQSTRNLQVRAVLLNGNALPGTFTKVYINASTDNSSIMVPANAIIAGDVANQLILVKKRKAQFVNVQTGMRDANMVEIKQGVNVGDTIVVTGVLFARPKSALKIRKVMTIDQIRAADKTQSPG